jgi:hypothetical protein
VSNEFYLKKIYGCTVEDIDIYFKYNNTVIYSTDETTIVSNENGRYKARILELVSMNYIEDYDSGQDGMRYCRPEILTAQDIISFFTGNPITVYNEINSCFSMIEKYDHVQRNTTLIIEGKDYTNQLVELIRKIQKEEELIISLLDRWRKANYLRSESCDANLYHDESILSYFHIIELFAENFNTEFKNMLDNNVEKLLNTYYSDNFFYNENQIIGKVNSLREVIREMLVGRELSLAQKIKYFLKKYKLLDDNVSYFIDSSIKVRNSIAHGRIAYRKKVTYPLPPFFYLANNSYEILEFLNFLTARMISVYIGIECWKQEWEEAKTFLMPPEYILNNFLKDTSTFEEINKNNLCVGNPKNITWRTIFNHYIENPKKFNINRIANALKEYFINTEIIEENYIDLLNISVVLSDCNDSDAKEKAIYNIKCIIEQGLSNRSELRDLNRYLDSYNVASDWCTKFLGNRNI